MTRTPKTSAVQQAGSFIKVDVVAVREADAITLMVHHLSLAAAYFEATPSDNQPALDEIADTFGEGSFGAVAAEAFVTTLQAEYDRDELNWGGQGANDAG